MDSLAAAADARFEDGVRLLDTAQPAQALACFRDAIAMAPDFAEAHANIAYLLDQDGDASAAEMHYRRALALEPGLAQTWLNFGGFLTRERRPGEAEEACRRAVFLDSAHPAAWSNLGVLLTAGKREAEAEQCYRTALALDPAHAKSAFNLAYLLLRQGRYEEGWARFESRDWYQATAARLRCPRWSGEALAGKSVLVGTEAGHGDMIQFSRYAPLLKHKGAVRVSLLCHAPLKPLLSTLHGVDEVIAADEELDADGWDFWTPPLSLPRLLETTLDSIPAAIPYLFADAARVQRWAARMGGGTGELRVGLVWKGNPRFENDADRSLPSLATLAPLGAIAGVRFYSLQKGAGEDEALQPPPALALTHLGGEITNFADTAAIMANLDLVIAVDTAAAHLAGALGRPCWVLLPDYWTDWRWLADRRDSPWYPATMRLFRQPPGGGWDVVIEELGDALRTQAATLPARTP